MIIFNVTLYQNYWYYWKCSLPMLFKMSYVLSSLWWILDKTCLDYFHLWISIITFIYYGLSTKMLEKILFHDSIASPKCIMLFKISVKSWAIKSWGITHIPTDIELQLHPSCIGSHGNAIICVCKPLPLSIVYSLC